MSIFSAIGKGTGYVAKSLASSLYGSWPGRVLGGGIAGGILGKAFSEDYSSTGQFKDTLGGAAMGAGLVGAAYGGLKAIGPASSAAYSGLKSGLRHPVKSMKTLGKFGLIAGAIAGIGYGLSSIGTPYAGAEHMSEVAAQSGISSTGFDPGFGGDHYQPERQSFIQSTEGLVQGLHRRRH